MNSLHVLWPLLTIAWIVYMSSDRCLLIACVVYKSADRCLLIAETTESWSCVVYMCSGLGLLQGALICHSAEKGTKAFLVSTAIGSRKYRIPSDLRSQAGYRSVSTMVGDHMGILGVVVFFFWVVQGTGDRVVYRTSWKALLSPGGFYNPWVDCRLSYRMPPPPRTAL